MIAIPYLSWDPNTVIEQGLYHVMVCYVCMDNILLCAKYVGLEHGFKHTNAQAGPFIHWARK